MTHASISSALVTAPRCEHASKHPAVALKYIQTLFVNFTSIELEEKKTHKENHTPGSSGSCRLAPNLGCLPFCGPGRMLAKGNVRDSESRRPVTSERLLNALEFLESVIPRCHRLPRLRAGNVSVRTGLPSRDVRLLLDASNQQPGAGGRGRAGEWGGRWGNPAVTPAGVKPRRSPVSPHWNPALSLRKRTSPSGEQS